jgi:hypothetical protein
MNKRRLALGMIGVGLLVTGVGIGAFIATKGGRR